MPATDLHRSSCHRLAPGAAAPTPVRRLCVLAVVGLASVATTHGATAADLPLQTLPPVVYENPRTCVVESPTGQVEVYLEPEGPLSGFLPAGMVVEVLDAPWSEREDLWIRIKPPRQEQYYGWVATATFICH